MERSQILYRDWIVKQISYGIDDLNYYIRAICYQVNKVSKEELFFEKFNITGTRSIVARYNKIDITKYGNIGQFKNCALREIEYNGHIYKVKLCSNALMIAGVKINPEELVDYVARQLGLSILNIETKMINCTSSFMISRDAYINHPNAMNQHYVTQLKFDRSIIRIYNSGRFIISCKSPQQALTLFTDLYVQSDLKNILKLLFHLKSSWFNQLPIELYDVILSKLVTSII